MMLMRLRAATMALSFAVPTSTQAAEGIFIEGTLDCGQWLEARAARRSQILEGYLIGFFNGMALGTNTNFWDAGGIRISREQVFFWMDKYCREAPLSHVITGASRLHAERVKR